MLDLGVHGLIAPATSPRPTGGPITIAGLLDPLLAEDPARLVLVGRSGHFSVEALDDATTRAAHALRALGVSPGDRVAAALPNDVAIIVAFLAAMKVGAIWVGMNRPLAGPEKAYMLADSQTALFLGDPEMIEQVGAHRGDLPDLRRLVVVAPGTDADEWDALLEVAPSTPVGVATDPLAPAAIAYTSGTTGFPKGAVHTQHNL
ncbi:MAG: AMP-binding protein, partial [Acidimicrobiales bacterium]